MISLIGLIISLILLMYLSYRGFNVLIIAPLMAVLACFISNDTHLLAAYTKIFMPALGNFVIQYFPIFLLGAIFGKLIDDSGSATVIANNTIKFLGKDKAILAIIIACAILTYGGVSLFVVAFAIYPIANTMFLRSNIPKRLIPGAIALGSFTFTMTALPGTTSIQNSIPMPHFGTTSFAAPGIGIIASILMFAFGYFWLVYSRKKAALLNENYHENSDYENQIFTEEKNLHLMRMKSQEQGFDIAEIDHTRIFTEANAPALFFSILPIICVISLNYIFTHYVFPNIDLSYLSNTIYGSVTPQTVIGIWSIILSLFISCLIIIITKKKYFYCLKTSINSGASAAVLPILNTASLVGFGNVVSNLGGFSYLKDVINKVSHGNLLISIAISVNILAAITGSASGGMSIALQTLADEYVHIANSIGISSELLHRITTIATGGLDSLPHNGAVVTLLSVCNLTHKDSYKDIFMVAVLAPIFALIIVILIGTYFGSF